MLFKRVEVVVGEVAGPGEGDEEYCGVLCCGLYCDLWFVTLVKRERPLRSIVVLW